MWYKTFLDSQLCLYYSELRLLSASLVDEISRMYSPKIGRLVAHSCWLSSLPRSLAGFEKRPRRKAPEQQVPPDILGRQRNWPWLHSMGSEERLQGMTCFWNKRKYEAPPVNTILSLPKFENVEQNKLEEIKIGVKTISWFFRPTEKPRTQDTHTRNHQPFWTKFRNSVWISPLKVCLSPVPCCGLQSTIDLWNFLTSRQLTCWFANLAYYQLHRGCSTTSFNA